MESLGFWWTTANSRERFTAVVAPIVVAVLIGSIWLVGLRNASTASCAEADEARADVQTSMRNLEHANAEDKCHAYQLMTDLLRRYQDDWRNCSHFGGKNAIGDLQAETAFYGRLTDGCI